MEKSLQQSRIQKIAFGMKADSFFFRLGAKLGAYLLNESDDSFDSELIFRLWSESKLTRGEILLQNLLLYQDFTFFKDASSGAMFNVKWMSGFGSYSL